MPMRSISFPKPFFLTKNHLKILHILILVTLTPGNGSLANTGDLRHARENFPQFSHVFEVSISLTLHQSQAQNHDHLYRTIRKRMEQLGYTIASPPISQKTPLTLVVKCEEVVFPGLMKKGPDSPRATNYSPDRPPCHISYSYEGQRLPWKNVDRIVYDEGIHVTRQLLKQEHGSPLEFILRFLDAYDFPVLMAAEWEHLPKLLNMLGTHDTPWGRKRLIVRLLGELQDPRGYSPLLLAIQQQPLLIEAAKSLGSYGLKARPHLQSLLQDNRDPLVQAAAANSLGRIAAQTGDSSLTPLFLKIIQDPHTDTRVKTEVVWALGKAPDMSAFEILKELEHVIWTSPQNDPEISHLRQAVDWSIREIKQGGHGDNF